MPTESPWAFTESLESSTGVARTDTDALGMTTDIAGTDTEGIGKKTNIPEEMSVTVVAGSAASQRYSFCHQDCCVQSPVLRRRTTEPSSVSPMPYHSLLVSSRDQDWGLWFMSTTIT